MGFTHVCSPALVVAADIVKSRGQHLFVTRDLNYPRFDLPSSPRPDPQYQSVTAVDSIGHSWYRALQIGAEGRAGQSLSWSFAYTWSLSERDTEDHSFSPQDQTNPQAERGPAANDTRHRLAVTAQSRLRWGLRLSPVVTLAERPSLHDHAGDGMTMANDDRDSTIGLLGSAGILRAAAASFEIDMRLAKSFRQRDRTIEAIVESFNVANRANWTGDDGKLNSPTSEDRPKRRRHARSRPVYGLTFSGIHTPPSGSVPSTAPSLPPGTRLGPSRNHRARRRGRHGRGVPGRGRQAQSHRCAQGPVGVGCR